MYLLKKVIQLRENSHPDHEKPFLEHLEDLRKMVFRIVITLLISMIVCFTFQKQLMDVLKRPVEQLWKTQMQQKLPQNAEKVPKTLTVDQWEQAKRVEHAIVGLDAKQKELFFATLADKDMVFHAKAVAMLRATKALPEDRQVAFIDSLHLGDDLRRQLHVLNELGTDTDVNQRGNLKMMSALKPTETFMLSMKLSFFAGIVISFPLLLMYVLQFVLPGLHSQEKRLLWPSMAIGFGLFIGGVLFAYFEVLPRALTFFYEWSGGLGVTNDWRIGWYISFATQFTLLFGVAFELPVVVMACVKLGMLTYETMSRTRSYAIVGILVLAAVLTPTPDVLTLSLMALPMVILYEICIWLAWFDRRKNRRVEEQEARERAEWHARRAEEESGDDDDAEVTGQSPDDDHKVFDKSESDGSDDHVYDKIDDESIENWEDEYDQFYQDIDKDPKLPGDDEEGSGDGKHKPDDKA